MPPFQNLCSTTRAQSERAVQRHGTSHEMSHGMSLDDDVGHLCKDARRTCVCIHLLFLRTEVAAAILLLQDFELGITADDVFLVKRFFAIRQSLLGSKLFLRQRCISTAVVCMLALYFRCLVSHRRSNGRSLL